MEISGIRIDITIGSHEVYRAPLWWIESLRGYPLGRFGVTLPDPKGELYRSIKLGDPLTCLVGYRNQVPVEWTGTVADLFPGESSDQLEVRAVDGALPLTKTRIVQAWENETPEAIVAWCIRQTGLPVGRVDSTGMVLPRFVAANPPVWQATRQAAHSCQTAFALDMSEWALWLGAGGVNWGDFDEPGDVPVIATQGGLISHEPAVKGSARPVIETFLLADLMHSRRIHLQDDYRGIDTTLRAQRVRHEGTPDRCRTFIWY